MYFLTETWTGSVSDIAQAIINAITSGLTGLVSAVPTAIKNTLTNLFFDIGTNGSTTGLSPLAIIGLIFGGISLAFGLSKLVYNLVVSKVG